MDGLRLVQIETQLLPRGSVGVSSGGPVCIGGQGVARHEAELLDLLRVQDDPARDEQAGQGRVVRGGGRQSWLGLVEGPDPVAVAHSGQPVGEVVGEGPGATELLAQRVQPEARRLLVEQVSLQATSEFAESRCYRLALLGRLTLVVQPERGQGVGVQAQEADGLAHRRWLSSRAAGHRAGRTALPAR